MPRPTFQNLEPGMPLPATPALTADVIIELADRPGRPIVLIERRNPPHGWALPGGFVEIGETVEQAAVREAREETSLGRDAHGIARRVFRSRARCARPYGVRRVCRPGARDTRGANRCQGHRGL